MNAALERIRRNAVEVYPDTSRYRGGFGVHSASSDTIYKISFDMSIMAWKCSCRGCIRHGQCKHLTAAGLKGRQYGPQTTQARELGFIP